MELWRLYRAAHGTGLDGSGGLYAAGRWHELGKPVVYFGASPAIVVLEKLAHIDPGVLPGDLLLGRFEGDVSVEELGEFPDIQDTAKTRARGTAFLESRKACVLRVPSRVVAEEFNFVVNPVHPEAGRIRLAASRAFVFDGRLL